MAEFSMLWETQSSLGDGLVPYTQAQAGRFFLLPFNHNYATAGPIYEEGGNMLAVSGTASPLVVDTGDAVVYQFRYWNTAAQNVAVSAPLVGDTGGRVVLRANWLTNQVRAAAILNTDGNPAIPALTQVAGTTWEISLCSFVIDTVGDIWEDASKVTKGVTDTRAFAISGLSGMIKLRETTLALPATTITFSDIQTDLKNLIMTGEVESADAGPDTLHMIINGTVATYAWHAMVVNNTTVGGEIDIAASSINLGQVVGTSFYLPRQRDAFRVEFFDYANVNSLKPIISTMGSMTDGTFRSRNVWGWWRVNPDVAITSITLFLNAGATNFSADSTVRLYGVL